MKIINTNNLLYKIFSVILAVLLWLFVSHQENPTTEQIFTVPVEVRDLSPDLVVAERPSFVKVRIQGQRQDLDMVSARDIHAFLEMDNMEVGMHTMEINVSVPGKTRLVSIIPSSVNIKVETMARTQVPVAVSFADNSPAKGFMALKPVLTPNEALVSGPQDQLKDIKQVYVEVNLGESQENYRQSLPVKVADNSDGLNLDLISFDPREVEVLIPVVRELPSKSVPVKVPITGEPAQGYKVERVVVEPNLVTIFGEFARLDQVNSLTATPVDISGTTKDINKKVNLNLPQGITFLEEESVTAVVRIIKLEEKAFSEIPIEIQGVREGISAEIDPAQVDVVLEASVSVIDNFSGENIKAIVDLTGLEEVGEHQRAVQVTVPDNVTLKEINPAEIKVNLQ
ncbi:MAG: CdaR family protein [Desulfitobacteriaceae bacterium]|nr:CdaR family protein [Desulfitobacteriaceae bacterium]